MRTCRRTYLITGSNCTALHCVWDQAFSACPYVQSSKNYPSTQLWMGQRAAHARTCAWDKGAANVRISSDGQYQPRYIPVHGTKHCRRARTLDEQELLKHSTVNGTKSCSCTYLRMGQRRCQCAHKFGRPISAQVHTCAWDQTLSACAYSRRARTALALTCDWDQGLCLMACHPVSPLIFFGGLIFRQAGFIGANCILFAPPITYILPSILVEIWCQIQHISNVTAPCGLQGGGWGGWKEAGSVLLQTDHTRACDTPISADSVHDSVPKSRK